MPEKRPLTGLGPDFNKQDYHRLRLLNDQLAAAEQWITRRSSEMVAAYSLASAQTRHTDRLDEDVELSATVMFLRRKGHPDCLTGHHNVVTRIDVPILPGTIHKDSASRDGPRTGGPFQNSCDNWCSLFLDLYENALRNDMEKALSIGILCIDVALIQQQLRSW